MSRTTTAATSAQTAHLSFGAFLAQADRDNDAPVPDGLPSPRGVNLASLCRNTFLHLESASPLAKMSQTRMIKSFREFSSQLDAALRRPSGSKVDSRRRHTLTHVVVDQQEARPDFPAHIEPNLDSTLHEIDETVGASPIARLSSRHHRAFDGCVKDDSYAPNLKQMITPDHTPHGPERSAGLSMDPNSAMPLLTGSTSVASCTLPLIARSVQHQSTSTPSPINCLPVTPTPMVSYFDHQGFFLPSELNQSDKDKIFNEESTELECLSPTRSPTRLRPLADLLTEPWGSRDKSEILTQKSTNTPAGVPPPPPTDMLAPFPSQSISTTFSPIKPSLDTYTPGQSDGAVDAAEFKLYEWAGSLPEMDISLQAPVVQTSVMSKWKQNVRNKGSLSDLVGATHYSELQNLFASAVAQAMLSGGSEDKKRSTEAAKLAPDEASGGHPNSCKPCAFFWSKGCLNGDKCRFCHEWHAPKKKKPMKDQKNLMIIAREDGRIAFLRCAIEDALRHQ
eukprot:Gregarina_sp_Poly_1__10821@NODE_835_length_6073_cov_244_613387_g603_i0_p1_GENE_NODE_835_length_6073_cov_244_613387_g603_i0NODE_835_length_6073_cov_244_613387_g603_i0_p1_ORF_typecomplete_len507_score55_22Torus/PF16131_5/0_0036zfCCCH_3/PF15663_5/0_0073zfCCCH_4/PF18044_1/1zfCCCH/PF00642_24/2_6_NODE_835_length_6073_cov_244_613387_g603_i023643884